ncbi:MAG: chromate transporter [Veillonella sp.]|jgi:chromate transporter|uniref:chromate transporter n=1 Tax=Veillonella sp. TaxID=1926307 RepID=UPI001B721D1F|nr:chromate transporter [Veillonella sp.]MBP6922900.1 chromate transporter [Veillonella sp.]MBP8617429.1 chromate transporter [Veillonella sp.]MBP9551273.1 chromate transporter [Veillonella sp.]
MEILLQLFLSFAKVGLFCIGGGYASMPLIQNEVVDGHHWITMHEFVDIFTISQMTPGPIGINAATFVGAKIAGIMGAIAATAGFVFPSVIIMLLMAYLYFKYGDVGIIRGVLNGLRPAVVALIASAGVGIMTLAFWDKADLPISLAETNIRGVVIFLISMGLIYSGKMGTIKVLLLSGVLGLVIFSLTGGL